MEDMKAHDYAVCLAGHGTRDKEGVNEFLTLSSKFKEREPDRIVECGFLEFARPTIDEAISKCVKDGANNIVVVPGLLMNAGHAKNDIPAIAMSHEYANIKCGRPLGLHPKILKVCSNRIETAENNSTSNTARADTLLMTVGRGSSDSDANSTVIKVSRMLGGNMGFGMSETSFMDASQPFLPEALEKSIKMGFKRVIVFPYFLFTGVLVKRIFSTVDDIRKKCPEIEFLKASYLSYDPLIVDVFIERVREMTGSE